MKMTKTILAMAAAMSAMIGYAGDSAPFRLDTVTTLTGAVFDSISLSYDASWIGGDVGATVVITDNGTEVRRTAGAGEFTHTLTVAGRHELTYTTYIGGVAQDEVYAATVYGKWNYEVVDGGAVMTETTQTSGAVTIPSKIDGYSVVGIESGAFSCCTNLTSVTIPDSVTSIGNYAFKGCSGLKSVIIPDSVSSIGYSAFSGCTGLTNIVFFGNAPAVNDSSFYLVSSGCKVLVRSDTTGWGVDIPGTWNGLRIEYSCYHDGAFSVWNQREAMCMVSGYTGDKICDLCGVVFERGVEIPALGHEAVETKAEKSATCAENG